jgi:hypothetical protein
MQKSYEAGSSDKQHIHHAATSPASQSSHEARIPGEHIRQATTGTFGARSEFGERLLAKIQPHKDPSSQRVQTQTHSSSSSYNKPGQRDKEAHLARVAKEEEDADSWSAFNVANYERNLPASVMARPTKPDIQATVFPTPKPVAPRQHHPPPRPLNTTCTQSNLPSSALNSQPHGTFLQQLRSEGKRDKARKTRAQNDLAADEDELPDEGRKPGRFFGGEVSHKTFNPSAAATPYQPPQTQNAADSSDARPSLAYGAHPPSGSNNIPGIHPGSLPSSSGLNYTPDNDEKSDPTNLQPPEGPFALNSAAGVRAIENAMPPPPPARAMVLPFETSTSSRTTTQMFMGSSSSRRAKKAGIHQNSPAPFAKAASKPPFYITANDLQLYKWRQEKLTWAATRERWSKLHDADAHVNRSEDSLRARFRAVQKLIETDKVTQELCNEVLNGVEGAEEELNRIVTEVEQQQQAEPGLQLETGGFKKITSGKNAAVIKQEARRQYHQQQQPYALNLPPDPPLAIAGTRPPSPLRPTAGGKFYDATTFQAYLKHIAEAREQDSDSDSDYNCREVSPICDADTVQWEYFMQRRDFTADDLAALPQDPTASSEEVVVEDEDYSTEIYNPSILWKTYTQPFRALSEANAEASRFVFATPPGSPLTFCAAGDFNLSSRPDAFGMLTVSLKSPMGLSQVRVGRRLLTYQDHVYPQREEKDGWIPRVFWCIVVKVQDNKKGMMEGGGGDGESSSSTIFRDKMYSSLALANSNAVDAWLELTLKIRSANLDQRKIERETAKIRLLTELERIGQGGDDYDNGTGEGARYFKQVLVEEPVQGEAGSGRRVEVFVQEVMLAGPRN